jgi:MurNAc alpha-1-phosphate uridylyltransferase
MAELRKAMILAAGLGSRLKPWTDYHPKALAMVNGKSLLQRNIEFLQCFGFKHVIVNVHHFAEQIISEIDRNQGWGSQVTISDERAEVLETGGGLKKAAGFFDSGPFVLMNVDILTILDLNRMMADHLLHKPLATLATRQRDTSRYFTFDESGTLCGWVNVKTGERKDSRTAGATHQAAFSGIHVIDPALLPLISRQGKFSMVDVYLDLAREHEIREFDHSDGAFIDVGKPESVELAERTFL